MNLKINNHTLSLNPYITQIDKNGKEFKVASIEKDLSKPSKWIQKVEHWHWIITIRYTDDNRKVKLTFDYNNNSI